ncbi:MAG: helix-turn-helix transcriptional regulator [Clostridia bacterium]|nr:helix-turn-helix transcriptional regulator [Clostridia bacterium]
MIKLSEIRRQEGITQKQLAVALNVSSGNLCDWEKGRSEPDIERLIKLADYFDVSIDVLVGRETTAQEESLQRTLRERLLACYNKMSDDEKEKLVDFLEYRIK